MYHSNMNSVIYKHIYLDVKNFFLKRDHKVCPLPWVRGDQHTLELKRFVHPKVTYYLDSLPK